MEVGAKWAASVRAGNLLPIFIYSMALLLALAAGWVLMTMAGYDPLSVYTQTLSKVFLSWRGVSESLVQAVPLGMGALAVAMAARLKLWNVGVEGQFMFGAFCAAGLALHLDALPGVLLLPLMLLAGFAGGGLLAFFCGLLRSRLGINEIVTTLLLNYVVGLWVSYWVHGPWRAPDSNVPETAEFVGAAQLPVLFADTRVHLGLAALLGFAGLCRLFLQGSVWGYRIRASGDNPRAARTAGIKFKNNVLLVMFLSGGLAGAGGMLEVSGAVHRLQDGTAPFYTMTVFMIAWLARLSLSGILAFCFLLAGLQVAGYYMQFMGLPSALVSVIEGVVLLSMIAFEPLRLNWLRRAGKGG